MFLSDKRIQCNECQEQVPPNVKMTFDEGGMPIHAEGCAPDFWAELMQPAGAPRVEGRYRGPQLRKPSVCPRCHVTSPCFCD
jgi:hypothetical protein